VAAGRDNGPEQLIRHASLNSLENRLEAAGLGKGSMLADLLRDPKTAAAFEAWRRSAAPPIAQAIAAAVSVIDFEGVVIDAMLHPPQRAQLVAEVQAALQALDLTGTSPVALREGSIGPKARVCGAAILPLIRQFSPDQQLLVKKVATAA
jgi:predicted NBD/HSP70 family sugar kinase